MTRTSTIPSTPIPGAPDASAALLAAWPRDRPLAMLASHGESPFARFSFAASPVSEHQLRGPETIETLRRTLAGPASGPDPDAEPLPTGRGYFVVLGYDLFRHLEPTAVAPAPPLDDRQWPDAVLLRCEGGLLHHGGSTEVRGDPARVPDLEPRVLPDPVVHGLHPDPGDVDYRRDVARVIEHVHAGDCFQVNLAQRFGSRFRGSVRSLAALAFEAAAPRYGAMLECGPGRAIVSMSPELFLETTPGPDGVAVRTRPIKGTRPSSRSIEELQGSEKDAAELHMIVDLMRNDLGRVCRIGSVRVSQPRTIESHPTVHHGVAEITGVLRPELGIADLVLAAFPPGSVTGAPKVQAMRIIDELEPVRRGPYCGAVGWIDDSGYAVLNVAIRTITATGTPLEGCDELDGHLDYFAGCGIVAESDPEAEYRESLDKTEVFRRAIENASFASTNR